MSTNTSNSFADPFLFSFFSNILAVDENANGSYRLDLLKDETEL